jgi:hypothetical protein
MSDGTFSTEFVVKYKNEPIFEGVFNGTFTSDFDEAYGCLCPENVEIESIFLLTVVNVNGRPMPNLTLTINNLLE